MNNDQYNEPDNGNDGQWNNGNAYNGNGYNGNGYNGNGYNGNGYNGNGYNGNGYNGNGYNGNAYNNGYNDNYNPYQPQNTHGPEESVTISIIAMVLGIISLVFSCCCYALSIMLGIAAIVLGIIGLKKEKKGKGFAIAGIVTGAVGLSFAIIMFVFELYLRQTGLYEELMNMYLDPNSSSWKSMR